jgi:hypothetical protein
MINETKLKDYQVRREKEQAAEDKEFNVMGSNIPTDMSKKGSSSDPKKQEASATSANQNSNPSLPDLYQNIGYMPKRGDFDHEYD